MSALPIRIRRARTQTGLSQSELARRVGVKRSAVTQWEHPRGTTPSVEHLIQIARETGTRFEWLATGRGPCGIEFEAQPALMVDDYARDELESEALQLFRRLPSARKRMALAILAIVAR